MRLAVVLLAVGCNARLGGPSMFETGRDGGDQHDASAVTVPDAKPDATPACANGRVIWLNFEGASLTKAGTSDATADKAVWMGVSSATLPKFRPGAGDRATQIADTVTAFKVPLAGHPEIQVVTARPATGPYFEIGFGGAGNTVAVPYTYAVNRLDCADTTTKSDLAYVFEAAESPQRAANFALGALLFGLGATGTTDPNDCMCGWLTNCDASNNACTYGTAETAATGCPTNSNPVDETKFLDGFCN